MQILPQKFLQILLVQLIVLSKSRDYLPPKNWEISFVIILLFQLIL